MVGLNIKPMLVADTSIGIHDLLGHRSNNVAMELNQQMGTNSVLFDSGDPMYSGYQAIQRHFVDNAPNYIREVQRNIGVIIEAPKLLLPILEESGLLAIPDNMLLPILTMPEIRPLFEEGQMDGFGLDKDILPKEDVYGRLAQRNGRVEFTPGDKDIPEEFKWVWKDTDPDYEIEELDAIDLTRGFICEWLKKEMKSDTPRDFTNDMNLMKP